MTLHVCPLTPPPPANLCDFCFSAINSQLKGLHEILKPLGLNYFWGTHTHKQPWPICFQLKMVLFTTQIENLQEQHRDIRKSRWAAWRKIKSLQADTTNTDTALTTLEEALAEKVGDGPDSSHTHTHTLSVSSWIQKSLGWWDLGGEDRGSRFGRREELPVLLRVEERRFILLVVV